MDDDLSLEIRSNIESLNDLISELRFSPPYSIDSHIKLLKKLNQLQKQVNNTLNKLLYEQLRFENR